VIQQLLLIAHVFIALGIILFVLLQRGKGAEAGAAFGSGASGTMFGSRGSASFLTRMTAFLAAGFFATSLALAFFANQPRQTGSVISASPAAEAGDDLELLAPPASDDDLPTLPEEGGDEGQQD
jgi:preprotein translocase subunit SecG